MFIGCESAPKIEKDEDIGKLYVECMDSLIEVDSLLYKDVTSRILTSDDKDFLSINKELFEIDDEVRFINYSIHRTNEDGSFGSLVEDNDTSLGIYKSLFEINGKKYEVVDVIKNNKIAPYNFLLDRVLYNVRGSEKIYIIDLSSDCEACIDRIIYRVTIRVNKAYNIMFCGDYLSSQ